MNNLYNSSLIEAYDMALCVVVLLMLTAVMANLKRNHGSTIILWSTMSLCVFLVGMRVILL